MVKFNWNICISDQSKVSRFAAEEFARLVSAMDFKATAEITEKSYSPGIKALWIGMNPAFPMPSVENPKTDDAIYIDVKNGTGIITGVNERSVLFAVYRFFREVGCAFLYPGRDGEYIPQKDTSAFRVEVNEAAAYRHRGICMEGSNSYENVVEMIDFAAKLGFNSYFTQLFRPAFTFKRWYVHQSNPSILPAAVSDETIDSFVNDYGKQIELRGMIHHRIGHGWIPKILGYTSGAWHEPVDDTKMIPGRENLIAQINGERKFFNGSGIDTNMCYSNPETQELLIDEVVNYAKENPDVEYLHFWLADQFNNQCECENCKAMRPADFYVEILNKIDGELSKQSIHTKIVFLVYLDLLWEPEKNKLTNPDRFVLIFAPIRRSYSVPMESDNGRKAEPYVRNGYTLPAGAGGTLPYLKAWKNIFKGDSFVFDYHYMWDYINDPGCYQSIKIMAQDVEDYQKSGLNGLMSCQNQRVFMPNGFGMNVMATSLWSGRSQFKQTADWFFETTYGKDGNACRELMKKLSERLDPVVLRGEKTFNDEKTVNGCAEVPEIIDAFIPAVSRNLKETDGVRHRAWECFAFYIELCRKISYIFSAAASGNGDELNLRWETVRSFVCTNEMRFQREFDVFEFLNVWENQILFRLKQQTELNT